MKIVVLQEVIRIHFQNIFKGINVLKLLDMMLVFIYRLPVFCFRKLDINIAILRTLHSEYNYLAIFLTLLLNNQRTLQLLTPALLFNAYAASNFVAHILQDCPAFNNQCNTH